jgi:hypothetical protein
MQQLERALLDLSERSETLPPDVLISRVEARLTYEGLLPTEGETVREPSQMQPRSASPMASTRLRPVGAFVLAAILILVAVGIAALVMRTGNAPIADEPAPPTTVSEAPTVSEPPTVSEAPTVPLTDARLTIVPEPSTPAAITVAGTGDIWVGANDGVWRFSEAETGRKGRGDVADLAIAPDGTVWAAFWSGNTVSLAVLKYETWVDYPRPEGYFGNITTDQGGTLWWGSNSGLHRLEVDEWVNVDDAIPDAYDASETNTLEVRVEAAPDGAVWVGTWWGLGPESGGLARFDGTVWDEIPLPGGQPAPVYNLAVAPNGDLWVVLAELGPGEDDDWSLARFDGDSWTVFTEADGMPHNLVYSMAAGPDGVVWLTQRPTTNTPGASGGGIVAFDGEQWTSFIEDENVRDVAVEPDGTVWLAGDRLYRIER